MNCAETKPKFGFYLDQTLPDGEMQELRNHLGECMICSAEFHALGKIEFVIQNGIYSEPTADYWSDLPQRITKRNGIRPKASALGEVIESVQEIFAAKSFRWGFAGAFAVAVLIFTLSKMFVTERMPVSVTQSESSESGQISAVPIGELNDLNARRDSKPQMTTGEKENLDEKKTPPGELRDSNSNSQEVTQNYLSADLLALNNIESKPLKTERRQVRGITEELYPIPNTEFILRIQDSELENRNNPLQRTFALNKQDARSSNADAIAEIPEEIKRIRSGFLETLWIVQESQTLEEKKNIWVSYINRESDITYRYLGVYNLALVLSEMTEKDTDPKHAVEARSFFLEHEKALRFQMGDERFDDKLGSFDDLLN